MFCDLVGSTALSARLDPEDLREVLGAYHRCVGETISRFGGFVAKYMGDGVLAYFGYPQAHEHDAERAVQSGLAIVEAIRRLSTQEPLQVRVGLATGLAVVGDLIGSGAAQEQAVIGETPNLAARLQALAEPDQVVIPENTRRLVGNLFEYESLGGVEVKGLPAPIAAFRILRESSVGSRFEALRAGETPLIGRDEELELLRHRWAEAKAGRGQIVLISAEPGIGKSRLAEAFRKSLESDPHTRLRYFCSPHHQDSALFPFIGQLERAARFERDDTRGDLGEVGGARHCECACGRRCAAACRAAVRTIRGPPPGPRPQPSAQEGEDFRRPIAPAGRSNAPPTGANDPRGPASGRCEFARAARSHCGTDRANASVAGCNLPVRV